MFWFILFIGYFAVLFLSGFAFKYVGWVENPLVFAARAFALTFWISIALLFITFVSMAVGG